MVKTKKSKKSTQEENDGEEETELINPVETEVLTKVSKDKKKSKKKKSSDDGFDDENSTADNLNVDNSSNEFRENTSKKAPKKKKNVQMEVDDDESLDIQIKPDNVKVKQSKKNKEMAAFSDDDEDNEFDSIMKTTKSKRQAKSYSVFQLLDVEESNEKDNESENEDFAKQNNKQSKIDGDDVEVKSTSKKEKKKKKKKALAEEEDEIERMLAELEIEYKGEKLPKKEEDILDKAHVPENENDKKLDETSESKPKKKKKKDKFQEETQAPAQVPDNELEEGEVTIKTAAQKKKEKKERGRLKKLEQNAKERVKQEKDKSVEAEPAKIIEVDEPTVDKEDDEEADDDKKKKDKKKKKIDKEKDDKKRPGRKQVLLMQEALKKFKEEEEKVRLEEEAKALAEQKAEELRLEKLRIEKERKEKKKLKEKERRERLKAEGKILTKTQKQQRARAEATLEALKAQGYNVPSIGEKREKTVRPGTRIRPNKNKFQKFDASVDNQVTKDDMSVKSDADTVNREALVSSQDEAKVEEPGVKDSWDMSSDEEDPSQVEVKIIDEKQSPGNEVKSEVGGHREVEVSSDEESSAASSEDSSSEEGSDSESESEESDSDDSESSSHDSERYKEVKIKEKAIIRIRKRREENEKNRSITDLRSPIVCVLGHVDTGKTKILDKIRRTHVQDSEAGGITQQIGATMVPVDAIKDQAKFVKNFSQLEIKLPGLLIIDTPGHESFSNLRSRGSSLCDIAILVVDLMHGLEPQTLESINLLKQKKTPFIVALNKIDRLYDWKVSKNKDVKDAISSQNGNTQMEFNQRTKEIIVQFAEQGLNAALFYDNDDPRTYVSMVPTSAATGEGMGNLLSLVVELTQSMLAKRLAFSEELQATVLELKAIPGLGTTIDIILVNGRLREGDTIVLAGMEGPVVTQVRSLLMPQPLKELRVKNPYQEFKEVKAAQGVKLCAKDLEKAVAGLNVLVAQYPDEVEILKELVSREFHAAMSSIKLAERGVYVQASTLGSLEALLEFLKTSKIPYSGIRIGPVVKRDVMKASIMLEHDGQFAVILAFDVKIERDAQELADSLGVKIFSADIIYHLFDRFTEYREQLKQQKRDEFKHIAVFPCKLRILPQFIFNTRDPIVVGVSVEAGVVREGTPICVPSQEFLDIGVVTTIEVNHKTIDAARKGQEVCIKIEPVPGEAPKLYGRHFDCNDMLVSKITRESIDACKNYFRDDLQKSDWQLMIELKKQFQIL